MSSSIWGAILTGLVPFMVFGVATIALRGPSVMRIIRRATARVAPSPYAPIVEMVSMLIHDRPEQWKYDRYRLEHKQANVGIWVGNHKYGLSLSIEGTDVFPSGTTRGNGCNHIPLDEALADILWEAVEFHTLWRTTQATRDFSDKIKAAMEKGK